MKRCEVCGAPAVWQVVDTKVVGTFKDEEGEEQDKRAIESRHLFCEAHKRDPVRHGSDKPPGMPAEG